MYFLNFCKTIFRQMIKKLLCGSQTTVNGTGITAVLHCKTKDTFARLILCGRSSLVEKIYRAHGVGALTVRQGKQPHHIVNAKQRERLVLIARHSAYTLIGFKHLKLTTIKPKSCVFAERSRRVVAFQFCCEFFIVILHIFILVSASHSKSFESNATQYFHSMRRCFSCVALCFIFYCDRRSFCPAFRRVLSLPCCREASTHTKASVLLAWSA